MNIKESSRDLVNQILHKDYYLRIFDQTLNNEKMTIEGIQQKEYSDERLVDMWNSFWWNLPDSPAILRNPFFLLCDICEQIFEDSEE